MSDLSLARDRVQAWMEVEDGNEVWLEATGIDGLEFAEQMMMYVAGWEMAVALHLDGDREQMRAIAAGALAAAFQLGYETARGSA